MRAFCSALLCIFAVLAWGPQAHAQQQPQLGPSYHPAPPPKSISVDTDGKARALVAAIFNQYGLKLDDRQWEVWITQDGNETPTARAGVSGGKRYITFNAAFMARISGSSKAKWTLYAIAAHEVSHHLGNHVLRPFLPRQAAEREADYQAGFVLGRMGALYSETTEIVRWLPGAKASDYPPRSQRLCELGRGWRDGTGNGFPVAPGSDKSGEALLCQGLEPDPKRFALSQNQDIHGQDILFDGKPGIRGLDLATCAWLCENTRDCKAFSFDRWFGWCYLKKEIAESTIDPPSVIGVKLHIGLPRRDTKTKVQMVSSGNKRFHDTPIAAPAPAASLGACRARCGDHERCFVYTFLIAPKLCLMYETTEGPFIDETAVSGFKQQRDPSIKG